MADARRSHLRQIMSLAWGLYRAELNGPAPRTFADALAGAWRFHKRAAERQRPNWAAGTQPRSLRLAPMVQSPIRRTLAGQKFANGKAASASYVTSTLGR